MSQPPPLQLRVSPLHNHYYAVTISTHCTAVEDRPDERAVVVRHLFVVGAQEAHGLLIVAHSGVMPGHGLEAVVGDVLVGGCTQEPQEGHLYHSNGVAVSIHVGELRGSGKRDKEEADQVG